MPRVTRVTGAIDREQTKAFDPYQRRAAESLVSYVRVCVWMLEYVSSSSSLSFRELLIGVVGYSTPSLHRDKHIPRTWQE